jgi:hypothetical protein
MPKYGSVIRSLNTDDLVSCLALLWHPFWWSSDKTAQCNTMTKFMSIEYHTGALPLGSLA